MYLKDFENYLKLHVSEKSTKNYLERLNRFFVLYKEFNQINVNDYLQSLIGERTVSTVNLSISAFKQYCKFLKIDIEFPKMKKTYKVNRTTLTRDEVENEILPYFEMMFKDYITKKTIFRFMMLSCLRISEVVKLKKIDFKKDIIDINQGKGGKDRQVYLHDSIYDDVYDLINKSKTESAFNITEAGIRYMFNQINTMLNYKKHITPHTLRHAGALYIYKNNGKDLRFIMNFLGHESMETTEQYINYSKEDMKEVWKMVKYKKGK